MLEGTLTLLLVAAFLFGPTAVGHVTRKPASALVTAVVLTLPAVVVQAQDDDLPMFAILIAAAGAVRAALGVAAGENRHG